MLLRLLPLFSLVLATACAADGVPPDTTWQARIEADWLVQDGHHNVNLSPADLHCLIVWLDSCSLFYGVYEQECGAARRRGEVPHPTLE
jgi:hypothetical protein